ncbi:MAG: radical SAM family heme chaperone HemW [Saprospiraceae bacterium]|nr:radical SAM family heme chaperone HemW [Saprospiraceae bacterium]
MAGVYLHIPFCKQACSYCNFHFSTSLRLKDALLNALHDEIARRAGELNGQTVRSVYFGGGTPSLLTSAEINAIWTRLARHLTIEADAEVTLEANPDDLTADTLDQLGDTPVNRLSIGIQSFHASDLGFMNRAHNATQARGVLDLIRTSGWDRVTVDLIYGSPTLSHDAWQANLDLIAAYDIPHLSAYQLTVEPRTALAARVRQGKQPMMPDEDVIHQFRMLMAWSTDHGYEHYEISNLARPGHRAIHNSNYWNRTEYLGLGPSAHSLTGRTRQWNIASNPRYIKMMSDGLAIDASETLSDTDIFNETVMTRLRLSDGLELTELAALDASFATHFVQAIEPFVERGLVVQTGSHFTLTRDGRCLADHIASECFVTD